MSSWLRGKKILFFSPAFFGYENKIKDEMVLLGAEVDMFDERSINKSYEKALLKINPNIFNKRTNEYYLDILEQVKLNAYDYILFVRCDMPTHKVLQKYKENFIGTKLCLHMWDSLENIPNIEEKLHYFDHITSFDRKDCLENKKLKFRPLFYCNDYKADAVSKKEYKYDLSFIGTIHSDRYKILKSINDQAKKRNLKMYMYPFLQSKFIYYFYKITKKEFVKTSIEDFEFEKISSNDIANIVNQSRIIIDIQHPRQTGLTMRTIEMFGMKKKIITTNTDIVNYDFYDDRNILVINRNNSNLTFESISNDCFEVEQSVYDKYSLEGWVNEVLGENNE